MIKGEETMVNSHRPSLAPARPPAYQILRDGRTREETSLVSSFRRLAYCATESAGLGEAQTRIRPQRKAAAGGLGVISPSPSFAPEHVSIGVACFSDSTA